LIRLGDVERADSNRVAALKYYGEAQDRYHAQWQRDAAAAVKREDKTAKPAIQSIAARDWRTQAVREASFHATVASLIDGQYLFEAREKLRRWELEAPVSKLNGDYPLAEAEYFLAAGNRVRALAGLALYRQGTDISSALPDVLNLELQCLVDLRRTREAESVAERLLKQFPNHPAAARAKRVLGKP
jgi:TolA-binding protein